MKNTKQLESFTKYCNEHPQERFWQALRNWSNVGYVATSTNGSLWHDTFYDEED